MGRRSLVPPDGGWGWVIVVAFALFNFLVIPVLQNFGLIFQGKFKELGMSATDETFVVTSGLAIGMLAGFFYGPLIKKFNYRKVCTVSAFLTSVGIISMMYAEKMVHFLMSYGLLTSIGLSLGMTSYSYALNSYFLKRRSFATGFAYTITCMGSIAMPQLISFLLSQYDVSGTCLIIGGLSLNCFVSAALLQPVEWHMKEDLSNFHRSTAGNTKRSSIYTINLQEGHCSEINTDEMNRKAVSDSTTAIFSDRNLVVAEEKDSAIKEFFYTIAHIFDLSLLKDMSFLNLLMGLSAAAFAEQAFSVLTPFILADLHMNTQQIATFISVLSLTDLIFRFITPFIGNYFKVTSKMMCMVSFCLLTLSRSCLFLPLHQYEFFVGVALAIGVAKGVRTVYWTLVLPDYVPLKMLPSATGMHMVLNGLFLFIGGPILGKCSKTFKWQLRQLRSHH
ncbi:hypothetical protein PPYR_06820 [Photinus pyralis]|uniref:Major facilitator superfamily (MFS) profile domain-containing protein n=1 Tax=Photinus pyralis TaxID=7054 RepID=A0A5N4ANN7_PHOPY|nr:hypothetical protein PPYR_06820 [Photinus pyralis]